MYPRAIHGIHDPLAHYSDCELSKSGDCTGIALILCGPLSLFVGRGATVIQALHWRSTTPVHLSTTNVKGDLARSVSTVTGSSRQMRLDDLGDAEGVSRVFTIVDGPACAQAGIGISKIQHAKQVD